MQGIEHGKGCNERWRGKKISESEEATSGPSYDKKQKRKETSPFI
jgi:hypothetical protein